MSGNNMTRFASQPGVSQPRKRVPWPSLASFGILGLLLFSALASASETPSKIVSFQVNPGSNQIILKLSTPKEADLKTPLSKGERRLVLDIQDATLLGLPGKDNLLKKLVSYMPEISQATLDEFRAGDPLVRLVLRAKDPQTTATLLQKDSNTLVLQIIPPTSVTDTAGPSDTEARELAATPDESDSETAVDDTTSKKADFAAKTTLQVPAKDFDRKVFEADSLRRQRNQLSDQVKDLQRVVQQQNATIARIKAEQERLVDTPVHGPEKERIKALQIELNQVKQSFDQLKTQLGESDKEIIYLKEQLEMARQQVQQLSETAANDHIKFPPGAVARGGLLNTLNKLTTYEVNQLVDAEKAYRTGKKLDDDDKPKEAEASYLEALRKAPQVQEYALALAILYMNDRQYAKAQGILETALKYHEEDPQLLNELGKAALLQKKEDQALKYFRKALPSGVLSNYASTLRRMNKMAEAEVIYKLAIEANPNDSDLQFNLGNLYLNQKRPAEAQTRYMEALRINPNFAEAHFHLGLAYGEQGQNQKAIVELNQYLKLMPDAPNKEVVQSYLNDLKNVSSAE